MSRSSASGPTTRDQLATLGLTAAALGLGIATIVIGIVNDDNGSSPLLAIAVVLLALNSLRAIERDREGGDGQN